MDRRGSGVLLHVTSLPSPFGIGDLGPASHEFADALARARQSYWQILPLNPTDPEYDCSPYHGSAAFAGNPLLLSPELLLRDGLLSEADLRASPAPSPGPFDPREVIAFKEPLFARAHEAFRRRGPSPDFDDFCARQRWWLEDFALFLALKAEIGAPAWSDWPPDLRDREPAALESARSRLGLEIDRLKFLQFMFHRQWSALKAYCNERGIRIIGDIPIYVQHESADVWTHPGLFKLDAEKRPLMVAGVPPDYFSRTGQLWGHPIYRWDELARQEYAWWVRRFEHNLAQCDVVRVDHFRGFAGFWEVPASETTAIRGQWVPGPGMDFFNHLKKQIPKLPVIAEDLGTITPDVRELMEACGFPGMKVLLFAFGWDLPTNPYAPHRHVPHCVVYTGTHDNSTVRGWFEGEASPEDRERLFRYLGRKIEPREAPWEMIRLALMSVANTAILPAQDILGLGEEGRMNLPAVSRGNWKWRLRPGELRPEAMERLRDMTEICGRAP